MHHLAGAVSKIRRLTGSSPNHSPAPAPAEEEEEGEEEAAAVEAPEKHSPSSRSRKFGFGLVALGADRKSSSKSGSSKSSPDPRPSEASDKPSRRKSTGKNRSAESGPARVADHVLDRDSVAKHSADVKHAMDSRRSDPRHLPYKDSTTRHAQDARHQEGGKHNGYTTSGRSSVEEDGAAHKAIRSPEREKEVGSTQQSPESTASQQRAPEAVAGQASQAPDAAAMHRYYALEMLGYEVGAQIGKGSYAVVRKAVHIQSGRLVAVKIVTKAKCPTDFLNKFLPRELTALRTLQHPNLITVYNITESQSRFYIIMDVATAGDLLEKIRSHRRLQEAQAGRYFAGLVAGMLYVHSHNIVHRDLKCENLLLDHKDQVRITDFGFSRSVWTSGDKVALSTTFCGSFAYAAPEVLKAKPYNPFKSDVWSIGVILYTMVTGKLPFDDKDHKLLLTLVHEPVKFPESVSVSKAFKDIVCEILNPLPQDRISLQEIPSLQWFATFCFGADIPKTQKAPAAEQSQSSTTTTDQSSFETDSSSSNASGRQQQPVPFPSPRPITPSVCLLPSPPLLANHWKAASAKNDRQRAGEGSAQLSMVMHPLIQPHVNYPLAQPQINPQPHTKLQPQPLSPTQHQKLGDVNPDNQRTSFHPGKAQVVSSTFQAKLPNPLLSSRIASPIFQTTRPSRPISPLHYSTQAQPLPLSPSDKISEATEAENQTASCLTGHLQIQTAVYHATPRPVSALYQRPATFTTTLWGEQGTVNLTKGLNRTLQTVSLPPQQPTNDCRGWDTDYVSGISPQKSFNEEKQAVSFPRQRPRSAVEPRQKPTQPVSLRKTDGASAKLHLDSTFLQENRLQPRTVVILPPLTSPGLLSSHPAFENDTATRSRADRPFSQASATPPFNLPFNQASAGMEATRALSPAALYRYPPTNPTHATAVIAGTEESLGNDSPVFWDSSSRTLINPRDGCPDPFSPTSPSATSSGGWLGAESVDKDCALNDAPPVSAKPRSPECSGISASSSTGSSETSTRTSGSQSESASEQQNSTPSGSGTQILPSHGGTRGPFC